jgi:Bacterial capsule synthesis protein PGA_cap
VYQRRRLAAVVAAVAALLVLVVVLRSCGGGDGENVLAPSSEQARQAQLDAEPVELTLSFSGDLLIHSPVYFRALELGGGDAYDFAPMFKQIRPYVDAVDLAFCHVEVPMTPEPPQSYPIFNTPPALADGIAKTGWDVCDTASNHTLDQGQDGIDATLRALERAGVEHTGSYASQRAQRRPLIVEAGGIRIGYVAFTTDTNGIPPPNPWSVNVADGPKPVLAAARAARRAGADAVIVNMHWSSELTPEYVSDPSSGEASFARKLAASDDITAIVGQGPHVVQPIERVGGKFVVFSEGNLVSNQGAAAGLAAASQDGYIALLDLVVDGQGDRVESVRYVPVWVRHPDYVVLPVGEAAREGEADEAELRASYERTVDVVGRGRGVTAEPERLR